jgi:glutamate carboxypeptidase
MDAWIEQQATAIAARFERELDPLVGASSPSGDVRGAEEAAAVVAALAPDEIEVERVPCSSPDHAPDLLLALRGDDPHGARILLLGHLDTVIGHADHRPLRRDGDRLQGPGAVDMKGGDILALGVLRALAARRGELAEAALLLVVDEEWRIGPFAHFDRFAGWDACLCFEAGQLDEAGEHEAVVVRRKAAGTVRVVAHGRSAHSGSAPEKGANALLGLAEAARAVAATHDPQGPHRLTAVPTVLRSGDAFNVVPGWGELICDVRADRQSAFAEVLQAVPHAVGDVRLEPELVREWPGMDAREATRPLLERASAMLGSPVVAGARGGASDASHFASAIALTVDGLGPRGGGAHAPHEHVLMGSVRPRAQVALALAAAVLERPHP